MGWVKLSVSLSADDVALIDSYASETGAGSRSAVLQQAIRLLRNAKLEADYSAAWDQWNADGDEALWTQTSADGLSDAPR